MKVKNVLFILGGIAALLFIAAIFPYVQIPSESAEDISTDYSINEERKHSSHQVVSEINQAGVDIERLLDESIEHALDDYEDKMRFPAYSVPLDSYDWNVLNPRVFVAIPKPVFDEDGFISSLKNIKISIEVENFTVNIQQDLPVRVTMNSEQEDSVIELVQASIRLAPSSDPYKAAHDAEAIDLRKNWRASEDNSSTSDLVFSGVIPASVLQTIGEANAHLVAELVFSDGTEATSGAAIKLFESTANLEHIGDSYVEDAHLIIPVDLFAELPGYFRVQANLFDEFGVTPVAHLTEEIYTDESALLSGAFKVHIATLKEKGIYGPYLLKNINITKIPTKPDYKPRYGAIDNTSTYAIAGFDLDQYEDEVYVDPEMENRLAVLRKITGSH